MITQYLASVGPAIGNHLWQSTVFAAAVWLLALLLRRNQARVRYGLWLTASIKFLIPFSLLIGLGGVVPRPQHVIARPQTAVYFAMDTLGRPFSNLDLSKRNPASHAESVLERLTVALPTVLAAVWLCGLAVVLLIWFVRSRQVFATLKRAMPVDDGLEMKILRRWDTRGRIAVRLSQDSMEPGIFGIFRPVLIWPERLSGQLEDKHIAAIMAHESMHVTRWDNLAAAVHMVVESVFWFHPMVWWMERRMVQERERACDEAVVELLGKPDVYAEGLLKACRFCLDSPIVCVSGIGGADLRNRIVRIMTGRVAQNLTPFRRLLLGAMAFASLAVPVLFGVARATDIQIGSATNEGEKLKFAVVSIRQDKSGGAQNFGVPTPDGYEMKNMFLAAPILTAYVPQTGGASSYSDAQVVGLPIWAYSDDDRYDISAKVEEADLGDWKNPGKQPGMLRAMLQSMLADRLKLLVHRRTREGPVYSLVVGKSGPTFKESTSADSHPGAYPFPGGGMISMEVKDGELTEHYFGISIGQLTFLFSADRTILDRTGLAGKYDITLRRPATPVVPSGGHEAAVPPAPEVSSFSLAEQIGLKLEPARGQVETLVVDRVERPSEN